MIGDEETRRLVMRRSKTDRPECRHKYGAKGSTLLLTLSTGRWTACCTKCRRFTEWCLTMDEAVKRAEMGWWAL